MVVAVVCMVVVAVVAVVVAVCLCGGGACVRWRCVWYVEVNAPRRQGYEEKGPRGRRRRGPPSR